MIPKKKQSSSLPVLYPKMAADVPSDSTENSFHTEANVDECRHNTRQ